MLAKNKVTMLAKATGTSALAIPYIIQHKTPTENSVYMTNDMLLVSLVRMIFMACGTKDIVVSTAAK